MHTTWVHDYAWLSRRFFSASEVVNYLAGQEPWSWLLIMLKAWLGTCPATSKHLIIKLGKYPITVRIIKKRKEIFKADYTKAPLVRLSMHSLWQNISPILLQINRQIRNKQSLDAKLWLKIPVHGQTWILVTLLFPQWFLLLVARKTWTMEVQDARNIHPFKVINNFFFFFVFYSPSFKETLCSHDWPVEKKIASPER